MSTEHYEQLLRVFCKSTIMLPSLESGLKHEQLVFLAASSSLAAHTSCPRGCP
jgi:hypothetical protein